MADLGKLLIAMGTLLVLAGAVVLLAGRIPHLGHLPGDFVLRRDGVSVYVPIVTCILLSIILTLLLNAGARLLR